MKRVCILLILAGLAYGGYLYYMQLQVKTGTPLALQEQGKIVISQASDNLGSVAAVLGAQVQSVFENGQDALSNATDGKSDPIINHAVAGLQSQIKDLPKETVEKVKYEFCRGVISDYEQTQK